MFKSLVHLAAHPTITPFGSAIFPRCSLASLSTYLALTYWPLLPYPDLTYYLIYYLTYLTYLTDLT